MQKSEYISMIIDNLLVFSIKPPQDLQGDKLNDHLGKFERDILKIIAGFNKDFLEYFLKILKGKNPEELNEILKKMEKISFMIGPTGNLHYLSQEQIEHILNKFDLLKLNEISEKKISSIADEQLEKQFGATHYSTVDALENQLASAEFFLVEQGYTSKEIQEKFNKVRQDPSKLAMLFTLPQKEIYNVPPELQQENTITSGGQNNSSAQDVTIDNSQKAQDAIEQHIQSIQQDINTERAQKVDELLQQIKLHVKTEMTENYEKVFRQMHPDRLNRACKMLKGTKRKSRRMAIYLEWYTLSFLLSKIELKVEHWQVSSRSNRGIVGVYTAGIDFSRYDNIVKEFSDGKLTKVINIAKKILQKPTKKAIQKLGQDLIAETGFDEHLYFTQ